MAAVEVQMFGAWLDARARGPANLADFYQARFPGQFKPAFNAWLADQPFTNPSAPPTPFAHPVYRRPGLAEFHDLDRKAEETFQKGQYANRVSDAFQQASTMLAVALFFGGILQVFKVRGARFGLLVVAGIALAGGLLRIFGLPLQILGLQALRCLRACP